MTSLQKLFGYRSTFCASSSLTYPEVLDLAQLVCERLKADGKDVILMPVANTNSMLPTFDSNAVVLLEVCPFSSLREGDIVTRFSKGVKIIHRLNEKRGGGFWPVGDGNGTMDSELVTASNFDRRVIGILYAQKNADTDR